MCYSDGTGEDERVSHYNKSIFISLSWFKLLFVRSVVCWLGKQMTTKFSTLQINTKHERQRRMGWIDRDRVIEKERESVATVINLITYVQCIPSRG